MKVLLSIAVLVGGYLYWTSQSTYALGQEINSLKNTVEERYSQRNVQVKKIEESMVTKEVNEIQVKAIEQRLERMEKTLDRIDSKIK